MAEESLNANEVVLAEEIGHVSVITLNRPRQLNVISSRVVELVAKYLEKWEKDDDTKLVIFKGAGRAFSAGGDLKMFYAGRKDDFCLEVVYRMYWLCYHIHTYQKTMVALVHGIVMGGGAAMTVPLKFSVVTENTVFSMPEASVGLHSDCSFSYILPRLPGYLGEYLTLTNARLSGKDMVAVGLATHFVPSEKLKELENRLLSLNSADENTVSNVIEEFSIDVLPEEETILNKLQTINKCFCKESLEEIIESFEAEGWNNGNEWIWPVLKVLKRASPTGLKITLRSIREGRNQTLPECLKKEFRLTMNLLRSVVSEDVYEGIRAFSIDKDNAPKVLSYIYHLH
ncbi:3-hydroxyisobutyryl-CoA hydrolase-like protein 5 [Dendrobium catenatum]|uniref:3-hydroxyisobutyryl-CoA hydrolase n=1 Tax=Dendrobium catenatum TaxID=906689 RepID=A0A2I0VTL6_9ASPA|nr:3-hydroxyisobutyryl-CoA hydrolase-like protein 5 [Dendrobium catenatum]